jgi:predicted TIM-barrel fold metal-dependent hydrolase
MTSRSASRTGSVRRRSSAQAPLRTPGLRFDLHTHFYTQAYFDNIRESGGDFSFDKSPSGQTIITHRGARFFGITPPMTNIELRIEAMDRVGIDVQVVSLSTPNIFYTDSVRQPFVARMMNNAYADLVAKYPKRFKAFASIPLDNPDEALKELHRAMGERSSMA